VNSINKKDNLAGDEMGRRSRATLGR